MTAIPKMGERSFFVRQEHHCYLIKSIFLLITAKKNLLKWSDVYGRKIRPVKAA